MSEKRDVSLVVSDVDNTILDFFGTWGVSTKKAFEDLAVSRNISMDDLVADVMKNTHPEYRMHDLPAMVKAAPILQPKNEEEKAKFAKDDARIIHNWQKERAATPFYDGVVATIRKMKSNGCKFVLYSDGPVSSVVARLAQRNFPADLIDGIYAQPALPDAKTGKVPPLATDSKSAAFVEALGDKIRPLYDCPHKPNPDALLRIIKDMEIENPKEVVMVGDNLRSDCGGGNRAGVNTAWQKDGADVCKEAVDFYFTVPTNPNYAVGLERMTKQLEDPANTPTVVLEKGFKDLDKLFRFVPAKGKDLSFVQDKTIVNPIKLAMKNNGR
ncbi:MAG: HAD family hydrolase [Alphaproteobacteria bacterium]